MAGYNYINTSQPIKKSTNTNGPTLSTMVAGMPKPKASKMRPPQQIPGPNAIKKPSRPHPKGRLVDTLRVPQQPGDEIDDLIDFKAQSETEAIEEQMLKEIMEQSLKQM